MKTTEKKLNEMLGMTAEEIDALGAAYDAGEVTFGYRDAVLDGSPLDYIGTKRETFVIDAEESRRVRTAALSMGCTKSDIYRTAVREYLEKHDFATA